MLQALIHGKLSRELEHLEDVLTSNVFGLLSYTKLKNGIIPFLALARDRSNGLPLAWIHGAGFTEIEYKFWPSWNEIVDLSCEPDVVLRLDSPDQKLLVVVEAKHLSGKSSRVEANSAQPTDQLAKEWVNLVNIARREKREPMLIYLTANEKMPTEEIETSIRDAKKFDAESNANILWLSWTHLDEAIETSATSHMPDAQILQDLLSLLERLNLRVPRFSGISVPTGELIPSWGFSDE